MHYSQEAIPNATCKRMEVLCRGGVIRRNFKESSPVFGAIDTVEYRGGGALACASLVGIVAVVARALHTSDQR